MGGGDQICHRPLAAAEKEKERAKEAVSAVQCSGGRFGMINDVTAPRAAAAK